MVHDFMADSRNNPSPYICDNLKRLAGLLGKITEGERESAANVIRSRLESEFCVEDWLWKRGEITQAEYREVLYGGSPESPARQKLQAYRLNWLLELEREFASKGE